MRNIKDPAGSRKGPQGLRVLGAALLSAALLLSSGCSQMEGPPRPRLVMFVGVDVSGSFLKGAYFDDSMDFLARYLFAHLNGLGGAEVPSALFVGSLGGVQKGEPKAFFPIETFQNKSVEEIEGKLKEIFSVKKPDRFTDYNAFLDQVSETVKDRKMVLKPVSVVMISDGVIDLPGKNGRHDFKSIDLFPLEKLSRNVTLRLLYTSPTVGKKWETQIPRRRVKIWTQDGEVMATWKDPKIFIPDQPMEKQDKFLQWMKNNVDFGVRMKRVDS